MTRLIGRISVGPTPAAGAIVIVRVIAATVALVVTLLASTEARSETVEPMFDPQLFEPYADLLDDFVTEHDLPDGGLVSSFDYRAAMADGGTEARLDDQRARLARFDPGTFETEGSRDAAIAFWLNAYNFFMIAYILENPDDGEPVASVRDYGNLFSPYRVFKRSIFDVGGRDYSLSEIELDILLGPGFEQRGWKDARVHFAVNCASVGCPPLRNRPYSADNVESLLAENTRRALATPLHLRIEGEVLKLTRLFDWYAADFQAESGSARGFVAEHAGPAVADAIGATGTIEFIDYDWSLNSPDNVSP